MDFKFSVYQELCNTIVTSRYNFFRIIDYINNSKSHNTEKSLILRHDVDKNPKKALQMAKIEKKYDICSTYYFRIKDKIFNEDYIKEISDMGHEIGYHYECLSDAKGDFDVAIKLFRIQF